MNKIQKHLENDGTLQAGVIAVIIDRRGQLRCCNGISHVTGTKSNVILVTFPVLFLFICLLSNMKILQRSIVIFM